MIKCVKYTAINKNTCLGLVTVEVEKWGVELSGLSLHQKNGKRWVNLPCRKYEDNGEVKYYPYVRFKKNEHKDLFLQGVKDAVDRDAAETANAPEEQKEEESF